MNDGLDKIEVGSDVKIVERGQTVYTGVVDRSTPTMWVVGSAKFRKKDGYIHKAKGSPYRYRHIVLMTDDEVEQRDIASSLHNVLWGDLSLETLRLVNDAVRNDNG